MMIHLYTILPAGFLVFFQFIPAIRYKVILLHRINGYLIISLTLVSIAGKRTVNHVVLYITFCV
jgi:hypothetical protein